MADITITIDNALVPRLVAALRAKVHIPGGEQMTNLAFGKACIRRYLTEIVRDYERELAQASINVSDITIT